MAADVVVEFPLHVGSQFVPEGAHLLGEDPDPVLRKKLIIKEYEEHIEQRDTARHDTDHDAGRLSQHVENLWHRGLYGLREVLATEE